MSIGVGSIADDTADKVRRNLVVFSAVVIAIPALEAQISSKFFGLESVEAISPWRAWLATLVVLLYLFLRYHLDKQVQARRTKMHTRRAKSSTDYLTGIVQREFNKLGKGIAPSGVTFELSTQLEPGVNIDISAARSLRLTGERSGDIQFLSYIMQDGQRIEKGVRHATFFVSRWSKRIARFNAWRSSNKVDHEMLDLRLPYYLAAIACVVAGANLIIALAITHSTCEAFLAPAECSSSTAELPADTLWKLDRLKQRD